jgi:TolB protein
LNLFGVLFLLISVVFLNSSFLVQAEVTESRVLFVSNRVGGVDSSDSYNDIYIMNQDGSNVLRLTNNYFDDKAPCWSPDATRIAFESMRDGNYEIYLMNLDGSNQVNLTNNPYYVDKEPAWGPKVAFTSNRDGQDEIYTINPDGSGLVRLTTNGGNSQPDWSPDGHKICYVSNGNVFVMNADGSGQTQLTNNYNQNQWPAWSPDGTKIAYAANPDWDWEIYMMNADGTSQTNLTVSSIEDDTHPTWTQDGTKIFFQSHRDGNWDLYQMNSSDGGMQTRITKRSGDSFAPACYFMRGDRALSFDGVNDYAQPPTAIDTTIQGSFTLAAKVYLGASNSFLLLQRGNGVTGGIYYGFTIGVGKDYISMMRNIQTTIQYSRAISGDFSILGTTPAYIFLTYEKSTGEMRAYLNDQYIGNATTSTATIVYNWDKGFNIGAMRRTAGVELYYQATLYKWSLWNGVCTEAELTAIRNGNYSSVEKTPTVIYECNEGSGNTLTDTSGNSYNGTIYGATWISGS